MLRKIASSTVDITAGLVSGGIILYALAKNPVVYKGLNEATRFVGVNPSAYKQLETVKNVNGVQVDSFVGNYRGYEKLQRAIQETKINVNELDLNNNKTLFDNKEEIQQLILKLKELDENKYKGEIKLLNEINVTSQLIWGTNGPHPYNTIQGSRPNCQIMGAIQGQFLTPENIQNIKSKIRVANFNSQKEDFRIDTIVNLNGRTVYVPFETLAKWMSLAEGSSDSYDGSLSTGILTYAIEKGVENYITPPSPFPSAPPTIVSEKNYCHVFTTALSDDDLIAVLSKAPGTPTYIGTYGPGSSSLQEHLINRIKTIPSLVFKNNAVKEKVKSGTEKDLYSHQEERYFIENVKSQVRDIEEGRAFYSAPIARVKSSEDKVLSEHVYTVKEVKKVNDKHIITIIDSHNTEYDLTIEELRKHSAVVIGLSENFPVMGEEGLEAALLALIALVLLTKASNGLNRIILPRENVESKEIEIVSF